MAFNLICQRNFKSKKALKTIDLTPPNFIKPGINLPKIEFQQYMLLLCYLKILLMNFLKNKSADEYPVSFIDVCSSENLISSLNIVFVFLKFRQN